MERPNIHVKKILRSPSLKRKSKIIPISERVTLEKVLGLTVQTNAALDTDLDGNIAYPAGCVVVIYNSKKNRQSHILNASKKTITCLAFSRDGKHLVTGESGHQPAVRVWDLEDRTQVAEFSGHNFGINCVKFSPNLRYIVSIGSQHDMMVNVWNWQKKAKVASNKVAAKVTDLAFSEDGSTFVTVGNRHVKFWYLDASKSRINQTVPLLGRSGILGEQKNNFFRAVCCGNGEMSNSTFAITQSGLLCEFNEKRLLDKWVELRTSTATSLAVGEECIYIGCADGVVRMFSPHTLHFIASLPRPHNLGVDVAVGLDPSHMLPPPRDARYPDIVAVSLDDDGKKLTCVYQDHSLYVWDVHDVRKVGKSRSFLYHSGCIWGLEVYPKVDGIKALPDGSFITCSGDNTIRVWNCETHMSTETAYKRNIYSNELLKVLYTDSELTNIQDIDYNPAGKTDKSDTTYADKNGVRSVRVSPDGQHMASGDRMGNIRIHDLQFMDQLQNMEAHDSEVLCLEYTSPQTGVRLLASASRDRLLHVFDVDQDYGLVQTLDDHSSAITSVRFAMQEGQLHMISCGADKSLLFRTAQQDPEFQFNLNRHLVGKTTLYDMDVDPTSKFVATACQDRNIRIYNIKNGKQKKCYSGSTGSDGTLIRVELDRTGSYAATSCSDKTIHIYDFFSGECVASMAGHSEIVTGVKFMNDLRHLVTVSGDGCIYIWKLPLEMTEHMRARLTDIGRTPKFTDDNMNKANQIKRGTFVVPDPNKNKRDNVDHSFSSPALVTIEDNNANTTTTENYQGDYRFSVGQLPSWAKRQVMQEPFAPPPDKGSTPTGPKGRWAQNIPSGKQIIMKSIHDENNTSIADSMDRRRLTFENENLAEQLKGLAQRRDLDNKQVPIINDDEFNKDEDEDDDWESNSKDVLTRLNKDANFSVGGKVTMRQASLDVDDEEEEDTDSTDKEVIYYPHSKDSDTSDSTPNSFRVFEGESNSRKDGSSEGTDPTSLEDVNSDEEFDLSPQAPLTPNEHRGFLPGGRDTPDGEKFLKTNFESLGSTEEFTTSLQAVERELESTMNESRLLNPRLSFSTRFLSRGQQAQLQNFSSQSAMQKKKEEMHKAVDETRKRLQALGWQAGGSISDSFHSPPNLSIKPEKDLPSPPTRLPYKEQPSEGPTTRASSRGGRRTPSEEKFETPSTPERRKWGLASGLELSTDRKWKSMFDVSGRTSPSKPLSNGPRSKTPTSGSSNSTSQRVSPTRFGIHQQGHSPPLSPKRAPINRNTWQKKASSRSVSPGCLYSVSPPESPRHLSSAGHSRGCTCTCSHSSHLPGYSFGRATDGHSVCSATSRSRNSSESSTGSNSSAGGSSHSLPRSYRHSSKSKTLPIVRENLKSNERAKSAFSRSSLGRDIPQERPASAVNRLPIYFHSKVTKTELKLETSSTATPPSYATLPRNRRSRDSTATSRNELAASNRSRSSQNLVSAPLANNSTATNTPPGQTTAAEKRQLVQRANSHSYAAPTQSSTRKVMDGPTKEKENRRTSAGMSRRRGLNAGMKKTFKSTPNLAVSKEEPDVSLSVSKTAEDLAIDLSNRRGSEGFEPVEKSSPRVSRRSMPATKELKDPYYITSTVPVPAPGFIDSNAPPLSGRARTPDRPRTLPVPPRSDKDKEVMPPPPTSTVPNTRQRAAQDLTLAQAKDILMGKSNSLGNSQFTSKKADNMDSGVSSSVERPDSSLSQTSGPSSISVSTDSTLHSPDKSKAVENPARSDKYPPDLTVNIDRKETDGAKNRPWLDNTSSTDRGNKFNRSQQEDGVISDKVSLTLKSPTTNSPNTVTSRMASRSMSPGRQLDASPLEAPVRDMAGRRHTMQPRPNRALSPPTLALSSAYRSTEVTREGEPDEAEPPRPPRKSDNSRWGRRRTEPSEGEPDNPPDLLPHSTHPAQRQKGAGREGEPDSVLLWRGSEPSKTVSFRPRVGSVPDRVPDIASAAIGPKTGSTEVTGAPSSRIVPVIPEKTEPVRADTNNVTTIKVGHTVPSQKVSTMDVGDREREPVATRVKSPCPRLSVPPTSSVPGTVIQTGSHTTVNVSASLATVPSPLASSPRSSVSQPTTTPTTKTVQLTKPLVSPGESKPLETKSDNVNQFSEPLRSTKDSAAKPESISGEPLAKTQWDLAVQQNPRLRALPSWSTSSQPDNPSQGRREGSATSQGSTREGSTSSVASQRERSSSSSSTESSRIAERSLTSPSTESSKANSAGPGPVSSIEKSQALAAPPPGKALPPPDDCEKTVEELRKALRQATDLYSKLSKHKEEANSETAKKLATLTAALEDSRKNIESTLGTAKADFKPFPVDSENPNEQPKIKMSSILDHYSMQLSERVFDLLKERMDKESEDSKL